MVQRKTASINRLHAGLCVTVSTFVHGGAPSDSFQASPLAPSIAETAALYSSRASLLDSFLISSLSFSPTDEGRYLSAILSTTLPMVFCTMSPRNALKGKVVERIADK